jgi:hypothetical protein
MKRYLLGVVTGAVITITSAHATEILDLHSPITVVDPSNGEKFQLSPKDAGMLNRICLDDVDCIRGMAPFIAQHPSSIALPSEQLARLPKRPAGNVYDELRMKECEFAINHHQDLVQHCGFSP